MPSAFNTVLFSFKVWITSVLLAPLLYLTIDSIQRYNKYSTDAFAAVSQQLSVYIIFVVLSAIFSFITWLLFLVAIRLILLLRLQMQEYKLAIAFAGVVLSAGTFALILPYSFQTNNEFFYLLISNCFFIATGSWFYKLEFMDTDSITII